MKNAFATYHPITEFGFFCAVIGIGMFMIHPVFLGIGLSASFAYAIITGGRSALKFALCFLLPMTVLVTIINPLVNHRGSTILFTMKYSYITLEAAVYGLMMGFMIASMILWFSSYSKVMTSDKFVYLFGKIMPAISLVFSMVMRFIPNYRMQIKKISDAQKCIGQDAGSGSLKERVRHGTRIMSIMLTWSLENSIDSSDSMRSRGYGIKNRSTFSIYRFDRRDAGAAAFLAVMTIVVIICCLSGSCYVEYYPEIIFGQSKLQYVAYAAFACICFFPVAVEIKEVITWRRLQSEI